MADPALNLVQVRASLAALRAGVKAFPVVYLDSYYGNGPDGGEGNFTYEPSDTTSGWTGTGSISGTTLTLASTTSGAMAIGLSPGGAGIPAGVYVTGGSGTSWTLSQNLGTIASQAMTADNGGTILVDAAGHRYKRSLAGQMVTPKMFGAKGDTRTVTDGAMTAGSATLTSNTAAFTAADVGRAVSVLGAGAPVARFTASLAAVSASFTASISGDTMTVTAIASGALVVGMPVSSAQVAFPAGNPPFLFITAQTGGTPGGTGTYTLNQSLTTDSFSSFSGAATLMTVTALASGSITGMGPVSGPGIAANTQIFYQTSGTAGGVGTYVVNTAQTIASQAMILPGTLNTTVAGYTSAAAITLAANAAETVAGAGVSLGTDDTAAWQAWLNWIQQGSPSIPYTHGLGHAGYVTAGHYKITAPLSCGPQSQYMPNIYTDGASYVIVDAWSLTTGQIALTLVGGNSDTAGNSWGAMTLDGGSPANGAQAFRNNGYSDYELYGWGITGFDIGIEAYNGGTGGQYTEGFVARRCSIVQTNRPWLYTNGPGGTNSCRSSGLVDCSVGIATATFPVVTIGAGASPYLAPMDFTCWAAPTVTLIQNDTTYGPPTFKGRITIESGDAPVVVGGGNTLLLSGAVLGDGAVIAKGSCYTIDDAGTSGCGTQYKPFGKSLGALTATGQTIVIPGDYNENFGPATLISVAVTAPYWEWNGTILVNEQSGANAIAATLLNHILFNQAGYGDLTLGTDGNGNITLANANLPAASTTAVYTVAAAGAIAMLQ